jgi:hypothetical protein
MHVQSGDSALQLISNFWFCYFCYWNDEDIDVVFLLQNKRISYD